MIRVHALSYAFPGASRSALRDLEFHVEPGGIFGILGPAGSGKTALMRILAGQIREYRGEVSYRGKDYPDWGREFYERVAWSPAAPALFLKLSAGENLSAAARLYGGGGEPVESLLARAGLAVCGRLRAGRLPPGARKRLDLARALLPGPECLLADEPLAGLDEGEAALALDMLLAQKRAGRSAIVAASDARIRGLCDRWIALADGAIAETGGGTRS